MKDLTTDRTFYQVDLTYDRNSNITWAEDAIHTGFDVKYTLDDLNRLVMAEEGTESSGSIASRTRQELWTLTQTGNWELFKRDINGNNTFSDSGDFNDDRTHNVVNELTARDVDDNGTDDYTLTYDGAGNLTDDGESYTYVYDAWYRLRKVKNRSTSALIAELTYYGTNHRKGHHYDVDGDGEVENTSDDPWVSFAWNAPRPWQLVATFEGSNSLECQHSALRGCLRGTIGVSLSTRLECRTPAHIAL